MRRIRVEKRRREPTITLINIVFLMLIFFLIAGTLAPPLDPQLALISTGDLEGREPPDALVINADGETHHRGQPMDAAAYVERANQTGGDSPVLSVRIVPDRELPAHKLLELGRALQEAGAGQVFLVTRRSLEE